MTITPHIFRDGDELPGAYAYWLAETAVRTDRPWLPVHNGIEKVSEDRWTYHEVELGYREVELGRLTIGLNHDLWTVSELARLFDAILRPVVEDGAVVAWLGDETCTSNPDVLRPGNAAGNVYAAFVESDGLILPEDVAGGGSILSDVSLALPWAAATRALRDN